MYTIDEIVDFYRRKIRPGLGLSKDALVVDLGSGDKPFWRADVFVDKLSVKNNQRATRGKTIKNIGLFVDSDLTDLPFKDKTFDFSFASHILEHVEDPKKALDEIVRISKKGYLEFPNGFFEMLSPAPCHIWNIFLVKDKLVFVRKSKMMQKIFFENKQTNKSLASKMRRPFISYYWEKKIPYLIIDEINDQHYDVLHEQYTHQDEFRENNIYMIIMQLIRIMLYKKKHISKNIYNTI